MHFSTSSVFLVTLAAFEHLLFSCLAAVAAQAAGIALFNLDVIHALPSVGLEQGGKKDGRLFKEVPYSCLYRLFWTFMCTQLPSMPLTARMKFSHADPDTLILDFYAYLCYLYEIIFCNQALSDQTCNRKGL